MSKCPNCGSTLTCGCQKRKLANGKIGCTKCAAQVTKPKNNNPDTVIVNVKTD
jgi:hypothetical protein